jgi:hypothetical protein
MFYCRGEFATLQRRELVAHAWKDNKQVMVMSTNSQPTSRGLVMRKTNDGSRISITCPESIILYNQFMGGVDKGDQLRGYYRCRVKTRKFYKYIFFFLLDVAITNSFILYRGSTNGKTKTIKEFRILLSQELIGDYVSRRRPGRLSHPIKNLPIMHFPVRLRGEGSNSKRGKCGYCSKSKKKRTDTTWYCNDCQMWLCHTGQEETDCFLSWHKNL